MSDYAEFVEAKHVKTRYTGFDWPIDRLPPMLSEWQKRVVVWALKAGRAALFEDCGLGKTCQQLAWLQAVVQHTRKPVLLLTPLAVGPQTVKEAEKFGIEVPVRIVEDAAGVGKGISICNYDRLHLLDPSIFAAVDLDESSILKAYTGKTKQALCDAFESTPYRLAATATPSPNDLLELGNHSQFLGVMDSYLMIARWFQNDTMQAGKYFLKPHAEKDFWRWVASWAVCIERPSDIGGDDAGYILPECNINSETITMPVRTVEGSGKLIDDGVMTATTMHIEKRRSAALRAEAAAKIANATDDQVIVWCDTNYEADELMKLIPGAVEVRGSDDNKVKQDRLQGFTESKYRVIVTKPEIAGFGLNWQHTRRAVFVGLTFSYEKFYQALRRQYRFGQTQTVEVTLVQSDTELACAAAIDRKTALHELTKRNMSEAMREVQMNIHGGSKDLGGRMEPIKHEGDGWTLYHGDCVDVSNRIEDNTIDLCIHSPPFSNLYTYSDSMADMGNCANDAEFVEHYKYLIKELYRMTVPGRICAVHCKDMPKYMNRDKAAGLRDFPGMLIRAFEECGWVYHSRCTIWKDPVIEMQRTKNHGLLHAQLCKDSAASRQGMADYLLAFRKWTDSKDDFVKPVRLEEDARRRFTRYVGMNPPRKGLTDREYSIEVWQRYASPVWMDINQTNVLNYRSAKAEEDTKHICPLQLDVIERCIELWSNPGDLVYSPFTGIGSEGYVSLKTERRFVGAELKREYVDVAIKHLHMAAEERDAVGKNSLFAATP
jgi:DNA modification methylase